MKNRTRGNKKNGKLFCWHKWEPIEEVPENWDTAVGATVLSECFKCKKFKRIPTRIFDEIPDHLINSYMEYR